MTLNMLIYYSTLDILYKCIILQLERYQYVRIKHLGKTITFLENSYPPTYIYQ